MKNALRTIVMTRSTIVLADEFIAGVQLVFRQLVSLPFAHGHGVVHGRCIGAICLLQMFLEQQHLQSAREFTVRSHANGSDLDPGIRHGMGKDKRTRRIKPALGTLHHMSTCDSVGSDNPMPTTTVAVKRRRKRLHHFARLRGIQRSVDGVALFTLDFLTDYAGKRCATVASEQKRLNKSFVILFDFVIKPRTQSRLLGK